MESQTIKFKKVVVGAEEASGSNWLSKLSRPPKTLRCSNCKCVVCTHRQPGYATSEEDEEEEDYTVHDYKILNQIPEDTIEENNGSKTQVSKSIIDGDGDAASTDDDLSTVKTLLVLLIEKFES
nr:uncharacterized protein LOC118878622 [Drosophila suzukii]